MKKLVFIFFTTIVFTVSHSQTAKLNIEKDFTTYINLVFSQDFEKSTDYIVEDFFEILPKGQMINLMQQVYNNPSMEYQAEKPKILTIENAEKINDKYYSLLTYSNLMKMRFLVEEEETDEEKTLRTSLVKISLSKKFGSENVSYNQKTDFFEVNVVKNVCAVSKNGIDTWKFVTIESESKHILKTFIPVEILNKI